MIIKNITQIGNPVIRKTSRLLQKKDLRSKKVRKIIKDLIDSMHHHNLVGIAAPQIGVNLRIFISEIRETQLRKGFSRNEKDNLRVYINPVVTLLGKKQASGYEGCGSVGNAQLFCKVYRPTSVTVSALNEKGIPFELHATGLLARVIQHECDHLDGKIYLDNPVEKKSFMSRNEYLKKFQK